MVNQVVKVNPVWSRIKDGAPIQASEEKMVLTVTTEKLVEGYDGGDRAYMDLVLVVDTSGSMEEEGKLDKVKLALTGILTGKWPNTEKKQEPWVRRGDHVCIVTFNDNAGVPLKMEPVKNDQKSHDRVEEIVKGLRAGGNTNMQAGLQQALKEIEDFKKLGTSEYHTAAIILLSDGFENMGSNAKAVDVSDVLVDTIGFGTKHDKNVLMAISGKSAGGVYSNASDHKTTLLQALSPQLDYLKHIVAKDLVLTVDLPRGVRVSVQSGTNDPRETYGRTTQTFSISYLHDDRTYRFLVTFYLAPATGEGVMEKVFTYNWTYKPMIGSDLNRTVKSQNKDVEIKRTQAASRTRALTVNGADVVAVPKAVRTEETRLNHLTMIKEVKSLADYNNFEAAKAMLADGMDNLDQLLRLTNYQVSKEAITHMYFEVEGLLNAVDSGDKYKNRGGHCYVAACISSHERQRYVARGDKACRVRLFTTDRMNEYLNQAIELDA